MPSISAVLALAGASALAKRRNALRCVALVLSAASLAACAQSTVASRKSEFRQAATERHRNTRVVSVVRRHEPPKTAREDAGGATRPVSQGVASFYTEGTQTASGERFNPNELTAAHPSLPFGTRLRVTNVTTGQSVMVRVNDRGPFVRGRVVDVSYSAAQALGMVDAGTANVKLDVVQ